jgi:hypothetical protein
MCLFPQTSVTHEIYLVFLQKYERPAGGRMQEKNTTRIFHVIGDGKAV